MLLNWLPASLLQAKSKRQLRSKASTRPVRRKMRLEQVESRLVLSPQITTLGTDPTAALLTTATLSGSPTVSNSTVGENNAATIFAQNKAPTITTSVSGNVPVNGSLPITVTVGDVDAAGNETVDLAVSHGTLAVSLSGAATATGNGTGTLQIVGSITDLNNTLLSLHYAPTAGYYGSDSLTGSITDDQGKSTNAKALTLNVVGQAPVLLPADSSVTGFVNTQISLGSSFTLTDPNAGSSNTLQVEVHANKNAVVLTVNSPSGATISGSGSDIFINGTLTQVQNALNSVTARSATAINSAITLTATEFGQSSTANVNLAVGAVTTVAPTIVTPVTTFKTDAGAVLSLAGNSVVDNDVPSGGDLTVTLAASAGTLTATGAGVSGSGTGTITMVGAATAINSWLNTLAFQSGSGGIATVTINATEVTGGKSAAPATLTVNVNAAPTINVPAPITIPFGGTANISGLTVTDTSAVPGPISVLISGDGNIAADKGAGAAVVSGSGTGSVSIVGTQADVNAALATMTFTPNVGPGGGASPLSISAEENGLTSTNSLNVIVLANVGPTITAPATVSTPVETPLAISGIAISDPEPNATETVTLSVDHGTLAVTPGPGVTVIAPNIVQVTGTLSSVNTTLSSLNYTPNAKFGGTDTLNITAVDNGGATATPAAVEIKVTGAINLPPTITVPPPIVIPFGGTADASGVTVTDNSTNPGTNDISLTITGAGVITANSGLGAAVVSGSGTGSVTISGHEFDVNAALATLAFTPSIGSSGGDSPLSIAALENGQTASAAVSVAVLANVGPTIIAPASASTSASTAVLIPGIWVDDSDPNATETVQLSVTNGSLSGVSGAGVTQLTPNTLQVVGSVSAVKAALATLTYTPNAGFNGLDALAITATDNGGASATPVAVPIQVSAVNTPPIINAPATVSTTVGTGVPIPVSITDPDFSATETVNLSVTNGTLSGVSGVGVTQISPNILQVVGSVTAVNAALAGLTYTPNAGFTGSDTLAITAVDNTGASAIPTSVTILVTGAVNVPPTINVPAPITIPFGGTANVSGLTVTDNSPNAGSNIISLTVSGVGTVTANKGSGSADVNGSGTGTVSIVGNEANVNAALATLAFTPNVGSSGGASPLSIVALENGLIATGTLNVIVLANVGPTIDAPATVSTSPGAGVPIPVTIFDSDPNATETVHLSVTNGALSGVSGPGVTQVAPNSLQVVGSVAAVNAALAGLTYTPNAGFTGSDTLAITATDNGGTSATPALVDIQVSGAVNVPPTINLPAPVTIPFGGTANVSGITVTDNSPNAGSNIISLTILGVGTLTANQGAGSASVTGSGTGIVSIVGNQANVNAALATLAFTPNIGSSGGASPLSIVALENGLSANATYNVIVLANVGPTIDAPATISTSPGVGVPIPVTIFDSDPNATETVHLSVTNGTLSGVSGAGVTQVAPNSLQVVGSVAAVNAALAGLTYTPNAGFTGSDALAITAIDNGGTSATPALVDIHVIGAVNLPPTINVPAPVTVPFGGTANISGVTVTDNSPNAGSNIISLTVSGVGTLTANQGAGSASVTGSGTGSISIVGNQANVNAALATLAFTPNIGSSGGASPLSIVALENGLTANATYNVIVLANVGPTIDAPATVSTTSGAGVPIPVTIFDSDPNATETVHLSVTNGTLSGVSGPGVTQVAPNSLQVVGSVAAVNAALAGLTYTPNAGFTGSDALAITAIDNGGASATPALVNIQVAGVNNAPTINAPASISTSPGTGVPIAVSITDPDPNATETVNLSVANGTLGGVSGAGVTQTSPNSLQVTGTLAAVNTALAGLTYTPNAGFTGTDTLSISAVDNHGASAIPKSVSIHVTTGAIAPTIHGPTSIPAARPGGAAVHIGGLSVVNNDPPGSGPLTVTIDSAAHVGLRATGATGNGTNSITITGTQAQVNAALATLTFRAKAGVSAGSVDVRVRATESIDHLTSTSHFQVRIGSGPSLVIPVANVSYHLAHAPITIFNGAMVSDRRGFSGGTLNIDLTHDSALDRLGVQPGMGVRLIGLRVSVNGQIIGSYHPVGNSLQFHLNSNATAASVQQLLRSITFFGVIGTQDRIVNVSLFDGISPNPATDSLTVHVLR